MDSIRLPARLDSMEGVRSFVREKMGEWNMDAKLAGRVELALEEALVNISKYAYPDQEGDFEVHCSRGDEGQLYLEIHDWGAPFNPLTRERPDPHQDFASRRVGGWGVEFIRQMVDDLEYSYTEAQNILFLTFLPRATDLPEPERPAPG